MERFVGHISLIPSRIGNGFSHPLGGVRQARCVADRIGKVLRNQLHRIAVDFSGAASQGWRVLPPAMETAARPCFPRSPRTGAGDHFDLDDAMETALAQSGPREGAAAGREWIS